MKLIPISPDAPTLSPEGGQENVILGRRPRQGLRVDHATVSREHARLFLREGAWQVADLDSSNGTFVNGARVSRETLRDGDLLRLGEVEFRVQLGGAAASPGQPFGDDLFADDPSEIPSDRDAEGDDGGVVLEDPAAELAGRGAPPPSSAIDQTMIVPPNPMFRNPPPSAAPTGAARPKAMEHMVLKTRSKGGGDENLLKQDVGQFGGARQIGLIVLAVAVCAAIFWGVMNLTEQVVPEGGIPDAVEDVDGGD